jgi:hypothetical protein
LFDSFRSGSLNYSYVSDMGVDNESNGIMDSVVSFFEDGDSGDWCLDSLWSPGAVACLVLTGIAANFITHGLVVAGHRGKLTSSNYNPARHL